MAGLSVRCRAKRTRLARGCAHVAGAAEHQRTHLAGGRLAVHQDQGIEERAIFCGGGDARGDPLVGPGEQIGGRLDAQLLEEGLAAEGHHHAVVGGEGGADAAEAGFGLGIAAVIEPHDGDFQLAIAGVGRSKPQGEQAEYDEAHHFAGPSGRAVASHTPLISLINSPTPSSLKPMPPIQNTSWGAAGRSRATPRGRWATLSLEGA
jgi:hypothetical protein